jgi:AI-2 transport protein TqsA
MNNSIQSSIVTIAAIVIIIAGTIAAKGILLPIILAVFISVICAQPILWLEKHQTPYALAMLLVLLSIFVLFVLFGSLVGNSLAQFTKEAPQYEEKLRETVADLVRGLNNLGANIDIGQFLETLELDKILIFTASAIGEIGKVMSDSFIIMLITIFMLLEVKSFIVKTEVIEKLHGNSLKYLDKIGYSIRHYLSIKTVISLLTGLFIGIWLLILGVDYAILWGVIAFMLNYIPTIGSIIASVPTMLLALVQLGPGIMVWTGVGYLVINLVMGSVVEPKVMGKGMGLSTLVVFLSLIVWGFVLGTLGMFLSVPLTMAIKIMLEQNESTRWVAILLSPGGETKKLRQDHVSAK